MHPQGIHKGRKYLDEEEFPVSDLFETNKKRPKAIPGNYLQIASTGYGDHVYLDLESVSRGDVRVVQLAGAPGGTENSWKQFNAWLDYEMKAGRGAYDYQGKVL